MTEGNELNTFFGKSYSVKDVLDSDIFHSNYYEMIHSRILYSRTEQANFRNALCLLTTEANSLNLIIALAL